MIDIRQWDPRLLEALAKLAENNGRPDRAAAIREVIRERQAIEVAAEILEAEAAAAAGKITDAIRAMGRTGGNV
jgi:hypothetical protein